MTERPRLRSFWLPRRHPRPRVFSQYLEGELDILDRRALEAHVGSCARCQELLRSLERMVEALGSIRHDAPAGLADSVIAALRAESPPELATSRRRPGLPSLTVVHAPGQPVPRRGSRPLWPDGVGAAVRYCLARPQLRFSLPLALIAGAVLIMVNMGGELLAGRFDLAMCATCTIDLLVPFVVLNLGLLAILRAPRRKRL